MKVLKREASVLLYAILFLFFFQLLADFVEGIYAFGLLGTSIPVEMASLVLFFSPLLLLAFRKRVPRWTLLLLGEGVLVSRVVEAALDTRGRMIVSGLGVGCFLAYFPALLSAREEERPHAWTLGAGVVGALVVSMLLRVLGSGYDLSVHGGFQAIGWALALVASVLLFALRVPRQAESGMATAGQAGRPGPGRTIGLSLGLTSVWVLLYFCFAAPNVIARWTGASYAGIVAVLVLVLCAAVALAVFFPRASALLTPGRVFGWTALFVLVLALTLLAQQIRFPADPGGYPLLEPAVTLLSRVPLWLMLVLFPVLLIDWRLLAGELLASRQSPRALAASFGLSSLFFLIAILGQVFTTVYDYIPVVGPFFRDRFWLVFVAPGVVLALSTLLVRREAFERLSLPAGSRRFLAAMALICVAALVGVAVTAARPAVPSGQQTRLRVCTYNIQQGYDEGGSKNYAGQLELLRGVDADVIGLQESDTARIAGGNADTVRYFADRLDMHSYYGPKTVPGTFGIALLSKYPIEGARTFFMYSEGEQTATIEARIRVGGQRFTLYVTHLGNGGPMVQQEAVLEAIGGTENVLLMGDLNFRPDTAQYRLTTETLDDAWLLRWPDGVDGEGRRFDRRIDHVFVSLGMTVIDARYLTEPESDHPALVVEIEWR